SVSITIPTKSRVMPRMRQTREDAFPGRLDMTSRSIAGVVALLFSATLASAQWYPGQTAQPASSAPLERDAPAAKSSAKLTSTATPVVDPATPYPPAIVEGDYATVYDGAPAGSRFTVSAEYLMWWLKADRPALPLLTTGSIAGGGGALNGSDTTVLFRLSNLD